MYSEEKLKNVVASMLGLDAAAIGEKTNTDTVSQWDSRRHMELVIAIEEAFGISIPDEEVTALTSFPIIKAVVEEQVAARTSTPGGDGR